MMKVADSSSAATTKFMKYVVYAKRKKKIAPILDKDGSVIDDGTKKDIVLTDFKEERHAENFAANVRKNVKEENWKVWVKKSS